MHVVDEEIGAREDADNSRCAKNPGVRRKIRKARSNGMSFLPI